MEKLPANLQGSSEKAASDNGDTAKAEKIAPGWAAPDGKKIYVPPEMRVAEEQVKHLGKWILGSETETLDFQALEERKSVLEQALVEKPSDEHTLRIRRNITERLEKGLEILWKRDLNNPKVNRDKNDPKVRQQIEKIQARLKVNTSAADENVSIVRLLEEVRTFGNKDDLCALRLVGIALMEQGYSDGEQKSFTNLSKDQKETIRLGGILFLEAERIMLWESMLYGKMSSGRAQFAYRAYSKSASKIDIPDSFRVKFKGFAEEISNRFDIETEKVIEKQQNKERVPEKVKAQQPRVRRSAPAEKGINVNRILEEQLTAIAEDTSSKRLKNFYKKLGNQLDYAELVAEKPKTAVGKFVNGTAKFSARIFAHYDVFGVRGALRSIIDPHTADENLIKVRNGFKEALEKTQIELRSKSNNLDHRRERYAKELEKYKKMLSTANAIENAGKRKRSLRWADKERGNTASGGFVSSLKKVWKRVWDKRRVQQEEDKPVIVPFNEDPVFVQKALNELAAWHGANPDGKYKLWSVENPNQYVRLKQIIEQINKGRDEDEQVTIKQIWKAVRKKNDSSAAA